MKNQLLKNIILINCAIITASSLPAQSFSFNCSRDTTVNGCGATSCFTLQHIIPDIHANTGAYTVNPIPSYSSSCFPVYTAPGGAGTSAGFIQDDTYTAQINIGFPFHFYGSVYNRLVASTNGFLSFDNAFGAGYFSHFGIFDDGGGGLSPYSGPPVNLPSALYDRAVIMGPYHDLNPGLTTSPTQKIQYTVVGTAPHRKWILSYYKVPLYSPTVGLCDVLIENTHQIVLYESTGIVEVLIFDMQRCPNWNEGRAMVGMQNFNRDQGIMAPGRKATDNPWGSPGMYETWRFVPSSGASLFKRVELYTLAGALVTTGTVTNLNNGQLRVDFPSICAPAGTTTYIARSVYTKIDNPAAEIYGSDTIRVTRNNSGGLNATSATVPANCGQADGTATINVPAGNGTAPYQYSLNGGPLQSGNTFTNLAAATYSGFVQDAGGCSSTISITVTQNTSLSITTSAIPATCSGNNNGTITVTPTSGSGPYTFVLDGTTTLIGAGAVTFNNVSPTTHTVVVTGAGGCVSAPTSVTVGAGAALTAIVNTTNALCNGAATGTITVAGATGGTAPYEYSLNGSAWQSSNIFNGLIAGTYTVYYRDNSGCQANQNNIIITQPTVVSLNSTSTQPSCGNANGSITITGSGGVAPYQYSLNGTTWQSSNIFNGLAAGSYLPTIRDNNNCSQSLPAVTLTSINSLSATITNTNILCNGTATGIITVAATTGGAAPYEYSLNGISWQSSNTFNGLIAGTYTVYYRDNGGCQNSQNNISITQPSIVSLSSIVSQPSCGNANGSITITGTGGVAPYQYSVNGTTWQSSNIFNGLAGGSYQPGIKDNNGCTQSLPAVTLTALNALQAATTVINATCLSNNTGNIIINVIGGISPYRYSINNENWQNSNLFNVPPGTYPVYVMDGAGCTVTLNGIIVGMNNNLTLAMPGSVTICEGSSTQLAVSSIATQFSWSPALGLSNPNVANPTASPTISTPYTVTATLGTCQLTGTVNLIVNKAPIANAGADIIMCYGQSKQLQGAGGTRFTWSPATFLSGTGANPTITPDRDITYTLSVVDANNCPSLKKDTVKVFVKPPFKVLASPLDTVVHAGDKFRFAAIGANATFTWSPSTGLDNPFIANPELTVSTDNTYKVTAITPEGCKAEGFVKIRVYKGPDIYIPTGFTPNGDGKNDTFRPFPVGIKEIKYFRVFNRSGQLIFSTTRIGEGWDGRFKGVAQPSEIYVWMAEGITGNNEVITKKGTIMLIR